MKLFAIITAMLFSFVGYANGGEPQASSRPSPVRHGKQEWQKMSNSINNFANSGYSNGFPVPRTRNVPQNNRPAVRNNFYRPNIIQYNNYYYRSQIYNQYYYNIQLQNYYQQQQGASAFMGFIMNLGW